jgi:hypothetical protein
VPVDGGEHRRRGEGAVKQLPGGGAPAVESGGQSPDHAIAARCPGEAAPVLAGEAAVRPLGRGVMGVDPERQLHVPGDEDEAIGGRFVEVVVVVTDLDPVRPEVGDAVVAGDGVLDRQEPRPAVQIREPTERGAEPVVGSAGHRRREGDERGDVGGVLVRGQVRGGVGGRGNTGQASWSRFPSPSSGQRSAVKRPSTSSTMPNGPWDRSLTRSTAQAARGVTMSMAQKTSYARRSSMRVSSNRLASKVRRFRPGRRHRWPRRRWPHRWWPHRRCPRPPGPARRRLGGDRDQLVRARRQRERGEQQGTAQPRAVMGHPIQVRSRDGTRDRPRLARSAMAPRLGSRREGRPRPGERAFSGRARSGG